jgi:hypothetical protein
MEILEMCRTFYIKNCEWKKCILRPMRGWDDDIKMDVTELGLIVWTGLNTFGIRSNGELCGQVMKL